MKSLRHALPRFYHLRSSFAILGAVLAPVLLPVPADVVRGSTYIPYSRNLGPIREVQRKWLLLADKDGRLMSHNLRVPQLMSCTPVCPNPYPHLASSLQQL